MPEGGWLPGEVLTRAEALRGFTLDGAYAAFQENELGSIEVGKYADFVVLDRDFMTVRDPAMILQTKVLATFIGGELVYSLGDAFSQGKEGDQTPPLTHDEM